jgi:hypothetical protein
MPVIITGLVICDCGPGEMMMIDSGGRGDSAVGEGSRVGATSVGPAVADGSTMTVGAGTSDVGVVGKLGVLQAVIITVNKRISERFLWFMAISRINRRWLGRRGSHASGCMYPGSMKQKKQANRPAPA